VLAIKPDYIDPISWSLKPPRADFAKLSIYVRDRDAHPTDLDYAMNVLPSVRYMRKTKIDELFKGMPVGLQIIGRPGEEALVLRAARAFERERPWAQHRPTVA
jgi:Asp-tRNA(Asn)/Glu-tRNA(Gln) amidotransferase A subunit family amidase